MSTLTSAAGAYASSVTGHPLLAIILWVLVAIGVVVSIVLTLTDRDTGGDATVTSAEQSGSDNTQAVGGRDSIAQSGPGTKIALQGEGHTVNYHEAHREDDGRVFVDITPEELVAPFENQLADDAEHAVEKYLDCWLRVDGKLGQRISRGRGLGGWLDLPSGVTVFFRFTNETQVKRLRLLKLHDETRIVGKIESIERGSIRVVNCEIESVSK